MAISMHCLRFPALAVLALAAPAAAQSAGQEEELFDKVLPQNVLEEDAAEVVSHPLVQPLAAPHPRYPAVQAWSIDDAQSLLSAIEAIESEGLDPRDYRPDLRPMLILAGLLVAVIIGWILLSGAILPPR